MDKGIQNKMLSPHTLSHDGWKSLKAILAENDTNYHAQYVKKFAISKCKTDAIVFCFKSGDDYIKRAFLRRGFLQSTSITNLSYDIRWDIGENIVIPSTEHIWLSQ